MDKFVSESDLDEDNILNKLGFSINRDEDFDVFKCPVCKTIYLCDYEVGTIYTDAKNLRNLVNAYKFHCIKCNYFFKEGTILIGEDADEAFKVNYDDLLKDNWQWILKK